MEAINKALDDTYPTVAFNDLREGDRVIAWDEESVTEGVITNQGTGLFGVRARGTTGGEQIWEDATIYLVDRPKKELPDDPRTVLLRLKAYGEWLDGPFIRSRVSDAGRDYDKWETVEYKITQYQIEDFELGKVVPA